VRIIFNGITRTTMLDARATLIPKEQIPALCFPTEPVSITMDQRRSILRVLQVATRLGNAMHGKCRIVFQDDQGYKAVETTIWAFDPENIVLKHGTTIPVSRVVSIEIP